MKSHEYVEKYGDEIFAEIKKGETKRLSFIFNDILHDITDLMKARNISTKAGLRNVVEDQNKKWNAFAKLFNKKYGKDLIRMNAIRVALGKELSDLL